MHDEDDTALPVELLLAVPAHQRAAFQQLRDMAALKDIHLYPSTTDDGLVGFRVDHGAQSVRCPDLPSLKAQLIAQGVPLLSDEELQNLLQAFQGAFIKAMAGGNGRHGDH